MKTPNGERALKVLNFISGLNGTDDHNQVAVTLIQSLCMLGAVQPQPTEAITAFVRELEHMRDSMPAAIAGGPPRNAPTRDSRVLVADTVDAVLRAFPRGAEPHMAILILANEVKGREGHLELDACARGHGFVSEVGDRALRAFAERLRISIKEIAAEVAAEGGGISVDRADIGRVSTAGERPQS